MKTSLLLMSIFFFIVGVHCFPTQDGQSSPKRAKRWDFNEEAKEKIVDGCNEDRRKYAEENKVENMWKVEWSDDLEEKIKDLNKDCHSLTPGPDYRFFLMTSNEEHMSWSEQEVVYMTKNSNNLGTYPTVHDLEGVIPGQKEIGCGPYVCNNYKSVIPNVQPQSFQVICLLGPLGPLDASYFNDNSKPTCEDEGGEDDDGLCVPSGSPMVAGIPILTLFVFSVHYLFH